jgi:hypothetical protein
VLVGASCHFNPLVALFVNVRNFGNPEEADKRKLVMFPQQGLFSPYRYKSYWFYSLIIIVEG